MTSPRTCSVCRAREGDPSTGHRGYGRKVELRPYGKDGALVCFPCAMENQETTRSEFGRRLNQAPVTQLTPDGPIPMIFPRRKS